MKSFRFATVLFLLALAARAILAAASLPPGFSEAVVAGNLGDPTAMAFAPDGRLFVTTQSGQVRVIKEGVLLPAPFVTLPVDSSGERGLLGIAFDPDFVSNHFVYLYYTVPQPVHNRVSRFTATANGDTAAAGSEAILLDLNNLSATNHNGGALHFGPDGKLYIGVGENANGLNAQTLNNLLGKMLRINPIPGDIIPADNPFVQQAAGNNRAIWALGLRNPFTFAFEPFGSRLFINDVGQNTYEEINEGVAGSNYGWQNSEGPTNNPNERGPLHVYGHGSGSFLGCAITGGAFYEPAVAQFPQSYFGKYFFADLCGGWINLIDPASPVTAQHFASNIPTPVDLQVGPDGNLYYLARGSGGFVSRIFYTAPRTGTMTAAPATIQVCDGTGQGVTTLTWNTTNVIATEVRIGAPNGTLFSSIGPSGSKATGKWVSDGTVFYLQDVSNGLPLTAANTLATVTLHTTTAACARQGTIDLQPNPIKVCDGTGFGMTTVGWTASGSVQATEVHLNAPNGPLFSAVGSGGIKATGKWVAEGTVFYLQDVTGGLPRTAQNTLTTITAHTTTTGCGLPSGTLTAQPNPIVVCDGTGQGQTTLAWTTANVTATEVHLHSPTGPLFSAIGPNGTKATGKWVANGTTFYLQNVSSGLPLTPANTLSTVTVGLICPGTVERQ